MIMPEDYDFFIPGRPGSDDMLLAPVVIPEELKAEESGNGSRGGQVIRQDLVTRFSQVDINGHMNNTRYFDIIDDALYTMGSAAGPEKRVPALVKANYLSELRAGDCFTLTGYADRGADSAAAEDAKTGTAMYFEGADADKVKFRIAYEF